MKPIIGIITRPVLSEENYQMYGVYQDLVNAICGSGGIPVGIIPLEQNWEEILSSCDGVVFQGGSESEDYEKKYLEYCYEKNIPTLGICLGMQLMGTFFGGTFIDALGHKMKNKSYVHKVFIDKSSKLFSLLQEDEFLVNSRHKSAITGTMLDVVALTKDGLIEAIEDKTKGFFIGVQWHPESMVTYDKVACRLFDIFIDKCRK